MPPKISVIIPTYNRKSWLGRAIASVLRQSWQDFELLIVDDGSTDGTFEALLEPIVDPRVRTFRTANRGVSAARNFAVQMSQGEWIGFLDSDDEWLPEKLEIQMRALAQHSDLRWIHSEEIWIRNGKRVNPKVKHQKKGGDIFSDALRLCCVSPSAVLLQKSILAEVGPFREDFPVCEDYDLWLKISAKYPVGYTEQALIKKYGGHEDQLSRKYFAMDYWRIVAMDSLMQQGLSDSKKQLIVHELLKKAGILLQGYRKHGNLIDYDEIFAKMKKAESFRLCPDPH